MTVDSLHIHSDDSGIHLQVEEIPGFGNIGLIMAPEDFWGSARNRLEINHQCRVIISFGTEYDHASVISCYDKDEYEQEPVCLGKLRIVYAIRLAEAKARSLEIPKEVLVAEGNISEMRWCAFQHSKRIANLMCGSMKAMLMPGEETKIPHAQIIKIVRVCIENRIK